MHREEEVNKVAAYFTLALLATMLLSCGNDQPPPQADSDTDTITFDGDHLLPASIEAYKLVLESETNIVADDDLASYFGDSSSAYLTYGVVGLATANYTMGQEPMDVVLAQFDSRENAYGFYALARPDGIERGDIGTESYVFDSCMYYVSDHYVVSLSAANNSPKAMISISILAQEIASGIKKTQRPRFFALYPLLHMIVPSTKYYPSDYLGIEGLDSVYTTSYLLDGDTAVFFMTIDASGDRYLSLRQLAESMGSITTALDAIPYYDASGFAFDHPEHGTIVAGLVRSKLAGVLGYVPESHERLVSLWIKGLR